MKIAPEPTIQWDCHFCTAEEWSPRDTPPHDWQWLTDDPYGKYAGDVMCPDCAVSMWPRSDEQAWGEVEKQLAVITPLKGYTIRMWTRDGWAPIVGGA